MKSQIPLSPVTSSKLHSIGHDLATNTLAVQFFRKTPDGNEPGPVYEYKNVNAELYDRMRNAPSLGSFFIKEIQGNKEAFPYTRMVEEEEEKQAA